MKLKCSKCKKTLQTDKFYKSKAQGRGYNYYCIKCQQAFLKGKHYGAKWKAKHLDRAFLNQARQTARKRGLDFNLTVEDTQIPTHCPVLGIPLFTTPNKRTDNTPSLDRKDNNRGYIKGNINVISWRANQMKRDASVWELEALVRYVRAIGEAKP